MDKVLVAPHRTDPNIYMVTIYNGEVGLRFSVKDIQYLRLSLSGLRCSCYQGSRASVSCGHKGHVVDFLLGRYKEPEMKKERWVVF